MKRLLSILLLICLLCILLFGCAKQTYSYKGITGYDISQIERIETNGGYLQSFCAGINMDKADLLDIEYKPTDKDIYSLTIGYNEKDELPSWYGGMIYIHAESDKIDFVLDNDGYIYVYSPILLKSFVSVTPIDKSFFDGTGMFDQ